MYTHKKPYIIGIAGGTGSGKTTVATSIINKIGKNNIVYICHDSYYKDTCISNIGACNYDHPNSLDTNLIISDLYKLINGNTIQIPIYDYKTHSRLESTTKIEPKPIILIEGILIYNNIELRTLFDIKIYVDAEADERFIRRLRRDTISRGRNVEDIINQYINQVKPMHLQFVEPTKNYADFIIPSGYNESSVLMLVSSLETILKK